MLKKKEIKFLIVHCSDTPDEENLRATDIHKMHLDFGWEGIGYHKVICRNGDVDNGRPEYWIGAHTYGKNNTSLGVCLIGRNKFTDIQFLSLKSLLIEWKKKYPNSTILGHRDAINTKKTCPNFNVNEWCRKEKIVL
jgi:N-acetylmuramoyl-L-alanine amidase